jgi:hypothetical protein
MDPQLVHGPVFFLERGDESGTGAVANLRWRVNTLPEEGHLLHILAEFDFASGTKPDKRSGVGLMFLEPAASLFFRGGMLQRSLLISGLFLGLFLPPLSQLRPDAEAGAQDSADSNSQFEFHSFFE